MFDSGVFNYVNVLDKAADATWARNEAISNNIANSTTPNYKRQDVSFEKEFQKALGHKNESIGDKIGNVNLDRLEARTYTDYDGFSYRLDGNNVDIDTENAMLVKNQIKYNGLIDSINGEFTSLRAAMGK